MSLAARLARFLRGGSGKSLCAFAFLVGLTARPVWSRQDDVSLLDRLVAVETGCASICPPAESAGALGDEVARLADRLAGIKSEMRDALARVEALNRLIFGGLAIKPSPDLADPDNLLLARVLERKQGYCVGIASLYLVLAERLDLPVFAVATPSHVFVRYDDGARRINIETLQGGADIPDERYIREEKIPEASIRKGVFMRNLTTAEFLAQVHNNLGVIYSGKGQFERAAEAYGLAIDLSPRFPAPYYNEGNDLLKRGEPREAARRFTKSLRLYPTDAWALNNRGLAYKKMGKVEKARRDFTRALGIDPAFEAAKKNLETVAAPSGSP